MVTVASPGLLVDSETGLFEYLRPEVWNRRSDADFPLSPTTVIVTYGVYETPTPENSDLDLLANPDWDHKVGRKDTQFWNGYRRVAVEAQVRRLGDRHFLLIDNALYLVPQDADLYILLSGETASAEQIMTVALSSAPSAFRLD